MKYTVEREAALSEPKKQAKSSDPRSQAHRDLFRLAVAAHSVDALQLTVPTALLLALLDEHDTALRRAATMQSSFLEAA